MKISAVKYNNLQHYTHSGLFKKILASHNLSEFSNFKKLIEDTDNNILIKKYELESVFSNLDTFVDRTNKPEKLNTESFNEVKDISKFLVEYFKEIKTTEELNEILPLMILYWNKYIIYELIVFLSESIKGNSQLNKIVNLNFSIVLQGLKDIFYRYYNIDQINCKKYFLKLLLKIIFLLKETSSDQNKNILYDICIKTLDSEYKFK